MVYTSCNAVPLVKVAPTLHGSVNIRKICEQNTSFDYWHFAKKFTIYRCHRAGLGPSAMGTMLQLILSVTLRNWLALWLACKSLCMRRNCKVHSFSASYLRSTMHQSVFDRIMPKKEKKKKKLPICLFNVTCNIFVSKALSPYGLGTIANPAQSCHLLLWCCKSMLFSSEPR